MVVGLTVTLCVRTGSSQGPKQAPPGKLVDLGGYKLHLQCLGTGEPAVILEAGGGDYSTRWSQVQGSPRSVSGRAPMTAQGPGGANPARFHGQ
jgi:hypothetical protein